MKKFIAIAVLALTLVGSSFAVDDVAGAVKPVAKGTAKGTSFVVKHIATDVFAVAKGITKDVYKAAKYEGKGAVQATKIVAGQVKTVVKK